MSPGEFDVGTLVDLLDGAERPVVLAGSGAFFSRAGPALERFAATSGIPIVTTSAARGLVDDDHPMCLGGLVHGGVALASADVALVLGSRFNANLLYGGPPLFPSGQRIAQVDIEPRNLGGPRTPEVPISADVTATLDALSAAWKGEPGRWSGWLRDAAGAADASLQAWRDDAASPSEGIHPGFLAGEVAAFASRIGASLVADGGDSSIWGLAMGRAHRPGSMLYIGSALGTLGIGMPFALGIGAARADEPVVVFTGDGAFGLSAMEVDTVARYGPGVIVVVVNNGGWGDVSHGADHGGSSDPGASAMRYDLLGTAVGGHGETITGAAEIAPALDRARNAIRSGRVAVIDAHCDPHAVSTFMRGMGGLGLM